MTDVAATLAAKRTELLQQMGVLEEKPTDQGSISFGKRVGEGTSMAVDRLTAVSAQEQLLAMLAEVRRARARVADGSYGTCEVCGKDIPEGRLEARPWSSRCVEHA